MRRPRNFASRSDLAALHHGIDIALRLRFVDAVLGDDLGHEFVLALKRAELLLGKLVPLGADVLEKDLLGVSGGCRCSSMRRSDLRYS